MELETNYEALQQALEHQQCTQIIHIGYTFYIGILRLILSTTTPNIKISRKPVKTEPIPIYEIHFLVCS